VTAERRRFDVRFPREAYGHSSGWHPRRAFSLKRQPDLAPRMPVALEACGDAVAFRLVDGLLDLCEARDFPVGFMVKRDPATAGPHALAGLSSGGGSALFSIDDSVYRLKRCGQAYDGFTDEPYFTHAIVSARETLEVTAKPLGGLMTIATALLELEMAGAFRSNGLSPAIEPVGMLIVTGLAGLPAGASPAAVLYRIESDLRLDEVVYMALSPVLAELFDAGVLAYDPLSGWWDAAGTPMSAVMRLWPDAFDRVTQLGMAAGGNYRAVHEMGYLRGKGSSWFGNEVIGTDGRLSAVDFDGGTGLAVEYDPKVARTLRRFETECYCAESFTYLKDMRPCTLGIFGTAFIDGFRAGYDAAADPVFAQAEFDATVAAHLAVWPALARRLQFVPEPGAEATNVA
jgi:hypothetical protein